MKIPDQGIRLPFSQLIARRVIEELFSQQPQWKSGELFQRVVQLHQERGGFTSTEPRYMIARAVKELKADGLLSSPAHGWLRLVSTLEGDQMPIQESTESSADSVIEEVEDFEPLVRPEKELGVGSEVTTRSSAL